MLVMVNRCALPLMELEELGVKEGVDCREAVEAGVGEALGQGDTVGCTTVTVGEDIWAVVVVGVRVGPRGVRVGTPGVAVGLTTVKVDVEKPLWEGVPDWGGVRVAMAEGVLL